jgi:uroporphyrinogen decarboxylase
MASVDFHLDPSPDFGRLEKVLRRTGAPDRVPLFDLFSDIESNAMRAIGREPEPIPPELPEEKQRPLRLRRHANYMYHLGYDYAILWNGYLGVSFHTPQKPLAATSEGPRGYVTSDMLAIADRRGFDAHKWDDPSKFHTSVLDEMAAIMPAGMKIIVQSRGVLENTMDLLGHEHIGYQLYDDPDLVRDVFDAVGARLLAAHELASAHPAVGALTLCDDMGFKTHTLLSPATYRELLFPWHKRIVDAVHRHGKPIILHACGNLRDIIEDVIACGWDARQSFEDAVEPLWEARKHSRGRISLLGGFDVDKLSRMTPAEVREHTRFLFRECSGGAWALGTGNSVPNYIPVENFLAMIDEGRRMVR